MEKKSKYFIVDFEKEVKDSKKLADIIRNDKWISPGTIIVNCSPDYSSIVCQIINHNLSDINKDELFEQIPLEMPYPIMSQIWNRDSSEYEIYDKYLLKWINKFISSDLQYLFIDSGTLRGRNFYKLHQCLRVKNDNFRFASLYLQDNSIFTPDYYVEKFNFDNQGGLIFEWENPKNPNWNY